jgi:hypothetical protein
MLTARLSVLAVHKTVFIHSELTKSGPTRFLSSGSPTLRHSGGREVCSAVCPLIFILRLGVAVRLEGIAGNKETCKWINCSVCKSNWEAEHLMDLFSLARSIMAIAIRVDSELWCTHESSGAQKPHARSLAYC